MKSPQERLQSLGNKGLKSYQELYDETVRDSEVAAFIANHNLSQDQITRSLSKFFEYIKERTKLENQDESYIAKGYQPTLMMNQGYADVSYLETEELIQFRKQEAVRERIELMHLPNHLKQIRLEDLDFQDENRLAIYQALDSFVAAVGQGAKGLYVFGNFGVGKSYLMAYLAHRLSSTHQLSTLMLHYPTFVVDVKNAIQDSTVKEKIDHVKTAPVLILDDIGAEQHSSWLRDDVLQVILQHRMQENLPTFFTSNFSMAELERHFAAGKSGDETWQAKRVMERIRFLAQEIHLKGINRR